MNQLITLSLISLMSLVGMTLGTYVGYGFAPMYNGGGMAGIGGAGGLGGNFMSMIFLIFILSFLGKGNLFGGSGGHHHRF